MGRLTAAVMGLGFIGPVHVEGLRRAGVQVLGLLDRIPERGREKADRLGVPKAYGDLEELLADEELQVVHLATPNRLHYPVAKAVLQAGKHVICDKPLAMSSQESAELVAVAEASGRVAAVHYNLRYYPLCQEMRARVAEGALGEIRLVTGRYHQDWLFLPTDWNWRVLAEEGGAVRAIGDIGTHWMDLAGWVTGRRIRRVLADLRTFIPWRLRPRGPADTFAGPAQDGEEVRVSTEDYGAVILELEGGAAGVYSVSQISAGRKNRLEIEVCGSLESLWWHQEEPNHLVIGRRGALNELLIKDPTLLHPEAARHARYPGGHAEGYPDTFAAFYRDVYGYIEAGDFSRPPSFPTFRDGHTQMLLCEAILASSRDKGWVEVPQG